MSNEMAEADKTKEVNIKQLKQEKKALKQEQKAQKKEAKKRAKEIAIQEAELSEDSAGSTISTFIMIFFIIIFWIAILCALVKLDVGGFGTNVLKPILKDIPIVNYILPSTSNSGTDTADSNSGYSSISEAVAQIKDLELQLQQAQADNLTSTDEITTLKAEVARLQTFEDNQVEFQRIKTQFYEEVVYAENGPGADAYAKYYASMDPTTADYLYKQVVQQQAATKELQDYVATYSSMKPKQAAAIFEAMTDNLDLAAQILGLMDAQTRGNIMGAMNATVAAQITKIMDPNS